MSKIDTSRKQELCIQCQECCKVLCVPAAYRPDYKEALEFYKTRGCKLVYADGLMLVAMEYVCPHLTPEGCSIYEDRPDWCRQYDGRKDPVVAEKCLWAKEK